MISPKTVNPVNPAHSTQTVTPVKTVTKVARSTAYWGGMVVTALLPAATSGAPLSAGSLCAGLNNGTACDAWLDCKTAAGASCLWGFAALGVIATMFIITCSFAAIKSISKRISKSPKEDRLPLTLHDQLERQEPPDNPDCFFKLDSHLKHQRKLSADTIAKLNLPAPPHSPASPASLAPTELSHLELDPYVAESSPHLLSRSKACSLLEHLAQTDAQLAAALEWTLPSVPISP